MRGRIGVGMRARSAAAEETLTFLMGALADAVFPPRCVVPGCASTAGWLCPACLASVEPLAGRRCPRCAARLRRGTSCPAGCSTWPLDRVRAAGPYVGALREGIHALKYRGVRGVAAPLAHLAATALGATPAGSLVVGVPPHPRRLGQRWLDHAGLLAAGVARYLGAEHSASAVTRSRFTRPQVGLGLAERRTNLAGAFTASGAVAGRHVIVVDDVLTSGATACAVADAVLAAGARSVSACVVARADELKASRSGTQAGLPAGGRGPAGAL
jgi:predicted amidophosphoribosyltransferase